MEFFMGRLQGKVAVVTGANSGIGFASAKRFVAEGAQVFMTGRRQLELDTAVQEAGGGARGVRGDVSSLADLDRLYEVVRQEAGTIDVLFANAGGGEFLALGEITEEHYERTFATNVKGTLFTVQKALPLLRDGRFDNPDRVHQRHEGSTGFQRLRREQGGDPQLRAKLDTGAGATPIRVNVLAPGATSTPGLHALAGSEEQDQQMQAMILAATPLGRLGSPMKSPPLRFSSPQTRAAS
jgi:NAD(P)-dependent dehydrogenase (short-subunit alcohol dehydrogenase family)